jgi:hypothetical protein
VKRCTVRVAGECSRESCFEPSADIPFGVTRAASGFMRGARNSSILERLLGLRLWILGIGGSAMPFVVRSPSEVAMIAQLDKNYTAIICGRCGAAIPVSEKIAGLQEERRDDMAATPRTFMARCRSCENEGVYAIDSIRRLEGEPAERKPRPVSPQTRVFSKTFHKR